MKGFRYIAALLLAVMLCVLSACGRTDSDAGSGETENTAATAADTRKVESESADGTAEDCSDTSTAAETETNACETAAADTAPAVTDPPVTTVHEHYFVGAGCTYGGVCECGAVGNAWGHDFTAAGCVAPATCTRCGGTYGTATGHSYSGGRCSRCGDTNGPLRPEDAWLFNNRLTDDENAQALAAARAIVDQINAELPDGPAIERVGMAAYLVSSEYYKGVHVESGDYYYTAYGVFVKRESSCAGCCRALGLVLSCMGYQWNHVNENQWTHQWIALTVDGQSAWADGQIGWVGLGEYPFQ